MAQPGTLIGAILREIDSTAAGNELVFDQEYSTKSGRTFLFDSGDLVIKNPFTLKCDSGVTVWPESIIGCCITAVYNTNSALVIVFDGRISLEISLREEDFICLEAAVFVHHSGETIIFK